MSTSFCRSARPSATSAAWTPRRCRVVPNFIRDLPAPPPEDDPQLAGLPQEPFILYFGDVTVDKGAVRLAEAYRSLDEPAAAGAGRPLLP